MTAYQNGKSIKIAYAPESTFAVAPSGASGGKIMRVTATGGMNVKRTLISSNEVRADGMPTMARLGSKSTPGTYGGELSYGTWDDLMAAALRGTWATGTLKNANPPVASSFAIEEYEQDIDATTLYTGVRVTSMKVSMQPDAMATVEFGVMGIAGSSLSGASAPYFVSPTATTSLPLVATDAAITLGGSSVVDFTGCEFTWDLGGATQPVIGSVTSPDVFLNNGKLTGQITCLRSDATRQADYLAETELALVLTLSEPSPGTHSIAFTLPRIKFTDYSKNLGADNALISTLPFTGAKDSTSGTAIQIVTA